MSRATATLLATLDELDPGGRVAGDEVLLEDLYPSGRAANDEMSLAPPGGPPASDTTSTGVTTTATDTATMGLTTWIDALALTLAAGLRVGASGLVVRHAPSSSSGEPEVMDADQLAVFLGVDRKTVYDYAGRGAIPHRRLGKRLLFSRQAIVAWLAPCKAASREG